MPRRVRGVSKADQEKVDVIIDKTMNFASGEAEAVRSIRIDARPLAVEFDVPVESIARVMRAYFGKDAFPESRVTEIRRLNRQSNLRE